jgi:hypothetical protein
MSSAHDHIPEQTGTFLPVLVTRPGEKVVAVSYWLKNWLYFRIKSWNFSRPVKTGTTLAEYTVS